LRNTATWEAYAPGSEPALFIAGRGYTGHEHLPWFSLINMNGRVYDPLTGQFLNADNFNQAPDRLMGFNRYAYALNNPLLYTDPDGEFAWIPVIIGAIIGAYGGHEIAEAKGYDLGDWQGWAFMLGGAVIGGVSGGIGSEIMAGGGFMANTMSIAYSSTAYSIGMNALSGGMTDVNIGFGGFSYNITNNDWGYLGEKGNTTLANIGYGFGALANIQDIVAGFNGTTIDVKARPELSGHSQVEGPEILISVGPADVSIGQGEGLKWEMEYVKRSLKGNSVKGKNFAYIRPNQEQLVSQLYNVNGKWLSTMTDRLNSGNNLLNTGVLKYGLLKGCVNYTSRSLLFAGVVNLNAFLPVTAPVLLNAELFIRQMGIYASPFLINF
jgi:RHS repeat-associated protein